MPSVPAPLPPMPASRIVADCVARDWSIEAALEWLLDRLERAR